MTAWGKLQTELDAWAASGRRASLWWRDDDAIEPTAAFGRLIALSKEFDAPVALAVIPAMADGALARRLETCRNVQVIQHGYAHTNHAPDNAKKMELGYRPAGVIVRELQQGRRRLRALFARPLPLLAPPWNRMDPNVIKQLPALGLRGLSEYGPRPRPHPAPGLRQVNTHVDIVDWRGGRTFLGTEASLKLLVYHLRARRLGGVDSNEATGLLTHHLDHDEDCWSFVEALLAHTRNQAGVRWVGVEQAFH